VCSGLQLILSCILDFLCILCLCMYYFVSEAVKTKLTVFLISLACCKKRIDLEYTESCSVDPEGLVVYCANVDTLLLHVRFQRKNLLKCYIKRLVFPKLIMTTLSVLRHFNVTVKPAALTCRFLDVREFVSCNFTNFRSLMPRFLCNISCFSFMGSFCKILQVVRWFSWEGSRSFFRLQTDHHKRSGANSSLAYDEIIDLPTHTLWASSPNSTLAIRFPICVTLNL